MQKTGLAKLADSGPVVKAAYTRRRAALQGARGWPWFA